MRRALHLGHQHFDRTAHQLGAVIAELQLNRPVGDEDAAIGADDQQAVWRAPGYKLPQSCLRERGNHSGGFTIGIGANDRLILAEQRIPPWPISGHRLRQFVANSGIPERHA